jgi:hypothetical protein
MLRSARTAHQARNQGASRTAAAFDLLAGPVLRRKKTVMFVGAALALAAAGSASAATAADPATGQLAFAARHDALTAGGAHPRGAREHAATFTAALLPGMSMPKPFGQHPQASPPAAPQPVPPANQLMPVGTSGPQGWMPISGAQFANAATIVQQTLARNMGARSASSQSPPPCRSRAC